MSHKFELNEKVTHQKTGDSGVVIGRCDYTFSEPQYLIRFGPNLAGEYRNDWLYGESLLKIEEK